MKRRFLLLTFGMFIFFTITTHAQTAIKPSGSGLSASDPYLIESLDNLYWLSQASESDRGRYYKQVADIDASDTENWDGGNGFYPISFHGIYEGNDHSITNLYINRDNAAMFSFLKTRGRINNLHLIDVDITGVSVAGLVSIIENDRHEVNLRNLISSSVSYCSVSGSINGTQYAAGLVNSNYGGDIINSSSSAEVTSGDGRAAGLVLTNSIYPGSYFDDVGLIYSSYSTGNVTAQISGAGLVSDNNGRIMNSFSLSNVSHTDNNDGVGMAGFVSTNNGIIENSFAAGDVIGDEQTAGFVARNKYLYLSIYPTPKIENSYALGNVTGNETAGGFVARNDAEITNSYSTGNVSGSSGIGIFAAENTIDTLLTNVYWNSDALGTNNGHGTGLSTAQMRQADSFDGFDFSTVWEITNGGTFPYLKNNQQDPFPGLLENFEIVSGKSLTFDSGEIIVPDSDLYDDMSAITVEAWIYPNANKRMGIVEKHQSPSSGFWIDFNTDISAVIVTENGSTSGSSGIDPELNTWHHVAAIYDGTEVKIYLNGEDVSDNRTGSGSGTITNNSRDLIIGDLNWTSANFGGQIDEVRIWNDVRTESEIHQNMYQQLNGDEEGLIAYYPFNELGGLNVIDKTSNANNGTYNGSVSRSEDTQPYGTFITGTEGWRMMSSPFDDASYGELLNGLWTQGFPGADSPDFGSPNVLAFDEATSQFQPIANATDIPAAGEGFIVYVYDDADFDGTPDGFPKTVQLENTQTSGEITPTLSFTDSGDLDADGWNLVGNPYGATIDWDAASGWTKTNIDDAIYVWNDTAGEYQSWNGEAGTLPNNGLIAPWQGYWVKANGTNPSLSKTDDVRAAAGVFLKENPASVLELELNTGELSSKTVLMLSERAEAGKDNLDAFKLASLNGDYLSLFTSSPEGMAFDINALPLELESVMEIPLDLDGNDLSGRFELGWNVEAFPSGWTIELHDNETDETIELSDEGNYTFTMDGVQAKATSDQNHELESPVHGPIKPQVVKAKSSGSERFTIRITPGNLLPEEQEIPSQLALQQNYPNPFNPSTVISYQLPQTGNVRLEVYDMIGRRVATLVNSQVQAGVHEVNFNASNLSSGIYIYRLQTANQTITKKLTLIK